MKRRVIFLLPLLLAVIVNFCLAHPGRTDGNGGHTNRSTGGYHYHHGYSAHDHYDMNGDGVMDCPYKFKDSTIHKDKNSGKSTIDKSQTQSSYKKSENKSSNKNAKWIILVIAFFAVRGLIQKLKKK